ncbi:MAG: DUF4838 domain-containing protein [Lentisphaeria bacterium]|nr:DUF4838 domain-containing protein [Lentisphaeria bacterium]
MAQKLIPLLLLPFLLAAGEHFSGKAEPFTLKECIVTVKAPEFEEAAKQFATLLGKVMKRDVPIRENGNIIFEKKTFPDPQTYEIVSSASGIVLRAGTPMAADFASADLLRELGYRRFSPHPAWEIVPETAPETVAVNKRESPDYKMRLIWPGWGLWPEYRTLPDHHRLWNYANRMGGLVIKTAHAYAGFVHRNKTEFDAHPEYYALVKGKRIGTKLCISNPGLRKLFVKDALAVLGQSGADSVSADPSDGGGWCECAECAKLGTPTDRAILLANETAEAVSRTFPGKKVALYAYNQHSPPPSPGVKVHPDVIVNIATMFILNGMSVDFLLKEWGSRAQIGMREYYYAGYEPGSGRGCDLGYLRRTIPGFHRMGARYLTAEAQDSWGPGLTGWNLAAHLLWNVDTDADAVLDDFFVRAFPKSGQPMREFYALINAVPARPLSEDLLHRMYEKLDRARELASGREKERIEQLAGYTWFCEKLFRHEIGGRTLKTYLDLLETAAAIKPYYLVHTYSMFRDERRLGFGKKDIAPKFDWETPRTIDFGRIIADGLKNNRKVDFETVRFGYDLTPVRLPGKEQSAKLDPFRRYQKFYVWLDGGPLVLKVTGGLIKHYRNRGNVKLKLIQIGGVSDTGELETTVAADESVPPDGEERTVTLRPKHPGLHRLEMNDGADMTRLVLPAGLPAVYPVEHEKSSVFGNSCWFYVPKGTRELGYYAATARGVILSPDGKTFVNLAKQNGYYKREIPEQFTGKVWQVKGMRGVLRLLTVPDGLNLNLPVILVPRPVAEQDGLKKL